MPSLLKPLKCVSCPTVIDVDHKTEWCQCSACIQSNQPRPRHYHAEEPDDSNQLELGEVAK
jgi:hypothetical protein